MATVGFLVVHMVMLWLIAWGVPAGYRPRTTVVVLTALVGADVLVIGGVFLEDPRDLWSIPVTASMFAWVGAWLRYLWVGSDGRGRQRHL